MEGKIMSNAQMTALVAKCLGQSLVGEAGGPRSIRLGDLPELFTDCDDDPLTAAAIRSIDGEAALRATVEIIPEDGADRKSTRLLQSLMRISYAVFCLQKKNIINY